MGTNFYLLTDKEKEEGKEERDEGNENYTTSDEEHIGKRCGMGSWCVACDISLYRGKLADVHVGHDGFYVSCPKCGTTREKVATACSFTWNSRAAETKKIIESYLDEVCARDEYGDRYTGKQMLEIIAECKLQIASSNRYFW